MIEINKPLPNWEISPIFEGKAPNIKDFIGKPLLIMFFNLGCPGCKGRALPYANRVVVENGDKVNVVGIHTRFEGQKYASHDFEKAKEDFYIRFPIYKDQEANTFKKYLAGGTPHWILVNANGELEYSIFGSDPNIALLRLDFKINELLSI